MNGRNRNLVTDAKKKGVSGVVSQRSITVKKSTPDEYDIGNGDKKYVEQPDQYPDALEYGRSGTDQGIVIIINQVKESNGGKRKGSTKDVKDIIFTLGRLGYNIDEKYIFWDLSRKDINTNIEEILNQDLSDKNSLILFYLGHGDSDDKLYTLDGEISAKEIWYPLANHKSLENKPKLFVFQACKGESISTPFEGTDRKPSDHKISSISLSSYPFPEDMLICFSSAEGMMAYRDIRNGTWVIQEICKNFLAYGRREDVMSLLTRTAKCVSSYAYVDQEKNSTKQMPVIVSTLSKKFYLSKSKDRTNNLALYEYFSDIYEKLYDLSVRIGAIEDLQNTKK